MTNNSDNDSNLDTAFSDSQTTEFRSEHSLPPERRKVPALSRRVYTAASCKDLLTLTIEREIIPRLLMLDHANIKPNTLRDRGMKAAEVACDPQVVNTLIPLLLGQDLVEAKRHVFQQIVEGMSFETVLLSMLPDAARQMGIRWSDDTLSFVDVSVGLSRLQQLIRDLSGSMAQQKKNGSGVHILLATAPDDTHQFGIQVLSTLFRMNGWQTDCATQLSADDIIRTVAEDEFDVVGLSVSCDASVAHLKELVLAIRERSCNRGIRVLIGGSAFAGNPSSVLQFGADAPASSGLEIINCVESLLRNKQHHQSV